jgi:hypothetical protein
MPYHEGVVRWRSDCHTNGMGRLRRFRNSNRLWNGNSAPDHGQPLTAKDAPALFLGNREEAAQQDLGARRQHVETGAPLSQIDDVLHVSMARPCTAAHTARPSGCRRALRRFRRAMASGGYVRVRETSPGSAIAVRTSDAQARAGARRSAYRPADTSDAIDDWSPDALRRDRDFFAVRRTLPRPARRAALRDWGNAYRVPRG